jgi:hypothetical protein
MGHISRCFVITRCYPGSFQIKAQTLEKVLKYALIPYILVCHLQIDPDPDPAKNFDPDADPDPDFYLMRIRMLIRSTKLIRIRINNSGSWFSSCGENKKLRAGSQAGILVEVYFVVAGCGT